MICEMKTVLKRSKGTAVYVGTNELKKDVRGHFDDVLLMDCNVFASYAGYLMFKVTRGTSKVQKDLLNDIAGLQEIFSALNAIFGFFKSDKDSIF